MKSDLNENIKSHDEDILNKILNIISDELDDKLPDTIQTNNQLDIKHLEEKIKCQKDFFYFLEEYVPLHISGRTIKFKPHLGQSVLISAFLKYKYLVVNKTRQIGITTISRAIAAWVCNFFENVGIGVISKSGPAATDFIRGVIKIIDTLPDFLKTPFAKKSEQQFILTNGSYAMAEAVSLSSPDKVLRSKPITLLIIDEAAFISKLDIAMKGLLPTVSRAHDFAKQYGVPYGILIISTPNGTSGKGEWFFKKFSRGIYNNELFDENNEAKIFRSVELWWKNIPEFTEEWYQEQVQLQDGDEYSIAQEFDCTFLPTAKDFDLDLDILIEIKNHLKKPIEIYKIEGIPNSKLKNELRIFKPISEENFYCISIDVATSYGFSAYSVIQIMDYETGEQVAEYMGKLPTNNFTDVIIDILTQYFSYGNYLLVIENNTIGEPIVMELCTYPDIKQRMYYTKKETKKDSNFLFEKIYGLSTNSSTKPKLIESLFTFLNSNTDKLHSELLYLQLTNMKLRGNEIISKPNDLLMALSFFTYVKKEMFAEKTGLIKNKRSKIVYDNLRQKIIDLENKEKTISIMKNLNQKGNNMINNNLYNNKNDIFKKFNL